MNQISFTVYGVPQPAGSKKAVQAPGQHRPFVVDDAKKSRPWKQEVAGVAVQAMGDRDLLDGPLVLQLCFYVTRPKGHHGTGRNAGVVKASAPPLPTVKPDVLKLARAVEDALTGIVYRDDAQIVTELLRKRYGDPARVEVTVAPVQRLDELTTRLTGRDLTTDRRKPQHEHAHA